MQHVIFYCAGSIHQASAAHEMAIKDMSPLRWVPDAPVFRSTELCENETALMLSFPLREGVPLRNWHSLAPYGQRRPFLGQVNYGRKSDCKEKNNHMLSQDHPNKGSQSDPASEVRKPMLRMKQICKTAENTVRCRVLLNNSPKPVGKCWNRLDN